MKHVEKGYLENIGITSDPRTRAMVLRERVQRRELLANRLKLAAYLGDKSSKIALRGTAPEQGEVVNSVSELRGWVRSLKEYGGRDALARAVIASTRTVLPIYERWYRRRNHGQNDSRVSDAIEGAENWLTSKGRTADRIGESAVVYGHYASGFTDAITAAIVASKAVNEAAWKAKAFDEDAFHAAYAAFHTLGGLLSGYPECAVLAAERAARAIRSS